MTRCLLRICLLAPWLAAWAQPAAPHLPRTVVVEVKPAFRHLCAPDGLSEPRLRAVLAPLNATVSPVFPHHQPPAPPAAYARVPARRVDLSLIYRITYTAAVPLNKVMARLRATGRVVYAEPYYLHQVLYQPDDPALALQAPYLNRISLFEAWDVSRGDPTVTLAVVDSGTDWDHPDLVGSLALNPADTIDGLDNDNDGYVDNYRGWDLVGADFARPVGDNDPNVTGANNRHGTHVSGIMSATNNNGEGGVGVGFRCRLLPVKTAADNDTRGPGNQGYILAGYQGIVYAADHGADVINCSWGGPTRTFLGQTVVDYALERNSLVVAAAGNDGRNQAFYPAAHDGALSVTWSNNQDQRASGANYHPTVDITAPGVEIYSTYWDDIYGRSGGSSMAAPMVAGAAGLVKSVFPEFDARQVGEQLRVTADASFYDVADNRNFDGLLGRGRLNVLRALTEAKPAVRAGAWQVTNNQGEQVVQGGEVMNLVATFTNFLRPSGPALRAVLTTTSPYAQVVADNFTLGTLTTGQSRRNATQPFKVFVRDSVPIEQEIVVKVTYQDSSYQDFESYAVTVNPSFRTLTTGRVTTSLTSNGRVGYLALDAVRGEGFTFDGQSLLAEMGLIVTGRTSAEQPVQVADAVRSADGVENNDFAPVRYVRTVVPPAPAQRQLAGSMALRPPADTLTSLLPLTISYQGLAWTDERFVVVSYELENTGLTPISDVRVGLFADWDINAAGNDLARWDGSLALGYVRDAGNGPFAGIRALAHPGRLQYYAINNADTGAVPFGIYDGFADAEKLRALSMGTLFSQAGGSLGADVSHVVGNGPFALAPGQKITVPFALVAGNSLNELRQAAVAAASLYPLPPTSVAPRVPTATAPRVVPNPALTRSLTLIWDDGRPGHVEAHWFDLTGRLVHRQRVHDGVLTRPDVAGVYVLRVGDGRRVAHVRVVVP